MHLLAVFLFIKRADLSSELRTNFATQARADFNHDMSLALGLSDVG
jgi:hypothetical protein